MTEITNTTATQPSAAPTELLAEVKRFLEDMHAMPVDWTIRESQPLHAKVSAALAQQAAPGAQVATDDLPQLTCQQVPVATYLAPDGVTQWPAYSFEQRQDYARATLAAAAGHPGNGPLPLPPLPRPAAEQKPVPEHDQPGVLLFTAKQMREYLLEDRAALQQRQAPAPIDGVHWDLLPGYLIDHCEGDIISEEGLQMRLSDMLLSTNYKRIAAERDQLAEAAPATTAEPVGRLYYERVNGDWGIVGVDPDDTRLKAGASLYLAAPAIASPAAHPATGEEK